MWSLRLYYYLILPSRRKSMSWSVAVYDKICFQLMQIDCLNRTSAGKYEYHGRCLIRSKSCLPFARTCVRIRFFLWVRNAHQFSILCCALYVVCVSWVLPGFKKMCLFAYSGVQHFVLSYVFTFRVVMSATNSV
jgi:hypothetical protein